MLNRGKSPSCVRGRRTLLIGGNLIKKWVQREPYSNSATAALHLYALYF